MKVALVRRDGARSEFAISQDGHLWHDLFQDDLGPRTTGDVIRSLGDPARVQAALARHGRTVEPEQLEAPAAGTTKLLGVGRNYADHLKEMGREPPKEPILFTKWYNSITGPTQPIFLDSLVTLECDHEVELAVIIGKEIVDVSEANAMDAVFGYAVANDVTARDVQRASVTWDRSKGFDGYGPLGPWITTADEIDDWRTLELRCEVNGTLVQHAKAGEMIFGLPELIAFISRSATLSPGDVYLTGTPAGVRAGSNGGGGFLADGDVVVCEIATLGRLSNRVTNKPQRQ